MRLRTRLLEPPGGWKYTQPETGWTAKEITFHMLCRSVAAHRANNKLPTAGDLASEIEATICANLSPASQLEYCEDGTTYTKSVHWTVVDRFLRTAAAFVTGADPLVPLEEAERRASICAKCPLNVGLHGCAICRETLNGLRESLTRRRTTKDGELMACGVCGCDNRVQVHVPLSALNAGSKGLKYPDWCWKADKGQ